MRRGVEAASVHRESFSLGGREIERGERERNRGGGGREMSSLHTWRSLYRQGGRERQREREREYERIDAFGKGVYAWRRVQNFDLLLTKLMLTKF